MPYERYWRRLEKSYRVRELPVKAHREAHLAEIRAVRLNTLNYCPMSCSFCASTNFLHEAQGGDTAKVARLTADECIVMLERIVAAHPDVRDRGRGAPRARDRRHRCARARAARARGQRRSRLCEPRSPRRPLRCRVALVATALLVARRTARRSLCRVRRRHLGHGIVGAHAWLPLELGHATLRYEGGAGDGDATGHYAHHVGDVGWARPIWRDQLHLDAGLKLIRVDRVDDDLARVGLTLVPVKWLSLRGGYQHST